MGKVTSVITPEQEAKYQYAFALQNGILSSREEEMSAKVKQLSFMYEMWRDELYYDLNGIGDSPIYGNLEDWLTDLEKQGVKYAAKSTFYDKLDSIQYWLGAGQPLESAIRLSAERDGMAKKLVQSGVTEVKKIGNGRGAVVEVSVTEKGRDVLKDKPLTEYANDLLELTPTQTWATLKTDLGEVTVGFRSLHIVSGTIPFDTSDAIKLWGEVVLHDSQGDTPFQVLVSIEQGAPDTVVKEVGKKLQRSFHG